MAVNTRSRRVMEKSGLSFVRNFTGDWPEAIEGSEHGEVEYERGGWLTCVSGIAHIGGRSLAVLRLLRPFSHHSRQYFQP